MYVHQYTSISICFLVTLSYGGHWLGFLAHLTGLQVHNYLTFDWLGARGDLCLIELLGDSCDRGAA